MGFSLPAQCSQQSFWKSPKPPYLDWQSQLSFLQSGNILWDANEMILFYWEEWICITQAKLKRHKPRRRRYQGAWLKDILVSRTTPTSSCDLLVMGQLGWPRELKPWLLAIGNPPWSFKFTCEAMLKQWKGTDLPYPRGSPIPIPQSAPWGWPVHCSQKHQFGGWARHLSLFATLKPLLQNEFLISAVSDFYQLGALMKILFLKTRAVLLHLRFLFGLEFF